MSWSKKFAPCGVCGHGTRVYKLWAPENGVRCNDCIDEWCRQIEKEFVSGVLTHGTLVREETVAVLQPALEARLGDGNLGAATAITAKILFEMRGAAEDLLLVAKASRDRASTPVVRTLIDRNRSVVEREYQEFIEIGGSRITATKKWERLNLPPLSRDVVPLFVEYQNTLKRIPEVVRIAAVNLTQRHVQEFSNKLRHTSVFLPGDWRERSINTDHPDLTTFYLGPGGDMASVSIGNWDREKAVDWAGTVLTFADAQKTLLQLILTEKDPGGEIIARPERVKQDIDWMKRIT